MKPGFLGQQGILVFNMFGIWNAAVDRTNGCALRLFVKTHALRAFIADNIVKLIGDGSLRSFSAYHGTIAKIDVS